MEKDLNQIKGVRPGVTVGYIQAELFSPKFR